MLENVTLLREDILVRPDNPEQITKAGIIMPSEKKNTGEVLKTSARVKHVKVGNRVHWHKNSGREMPYNGEDFLILSAAKERGEVIAII